MAIQKVSKQENQTAQPPHDDKTEQLANLKALNSLLARETFERREHADTLLQSKEDRESELAEQKSILQDEMAESEIERDVSMLAFASQFGEQEKKWKEEIVNAKKMVEKQLEITQKMKSTEKDQEESMAPLAVSIAKTGENIREKSEIEETEAEQQIEYQELRKEVEGLQDDLDWHKQEASRLRLKMVELERKNAVVRSESGRLRMERGGLVEEKMEVEKRFESLMEERKSMQQRLEESFRVIEDLKGEIQDKVLAMDAIDAERAKQDLQINNLQREVDGLCMELQQGRDALDRALCERDAAQTDLDGRKVEVEGLVLKIHDLEKTSAKNQEELGQLQMERDELLKDREEKERIIELLKMKKASTERSLMLLPQLLEDFKRHIEELVKEKNRMGKEIADWEVEAARLKGEAANANATVSMLQESCGNLTEKNRQLGDDFSHQKDEFERVLCEKESIWKDLDQVKHEVEALEIQVLELRKNKEETIEELQHITREHEGLLEEKKAWVQQLKELTADRNSMKQSLEEAQQGLVYLQARIKSSEMLSKQALLMLKSTAEMLCKSKNKGRDLKRGLNGEEMAKNIHLFEVELEAIKGAFRSQAKKIEEMTKELKSLQISVPKSQKKSNWSWLSSVTTIVAAASITYMSSGR